MDFTYIYNITKKKLKYSSKPNYQLQSNKLVIDSINKHYTDMYSIVGWKSQNSPYIFSLSNTNLLPFRKKSFAFFCLVSKSLKVHNNKKN